MTSYKQIIVIRTNLNMSKGKIAVQTGHAAVSSAEEARKHFTSWWRAWLKNGQCKIAVKVKSKEELLELDKRAKEQVLPHKLIFDRGLTEVPVGTITCLGIGPAPDKKIDQITGMLSTL